MSSRNRIYLKKITFNLFCAISISFKTTLKNDSVVSSVVFSIKHKLSFNFFSLLYAIKTSWAKCHSHFASLYFFIFSIMAFSKSKNISSNILQYLSEILDNICFFCCTNTVKYLRYRRGKIVILILLRSIINYKFTLFIYKYDVGQNII